MSKNEVKVTQKEETALAIPEANMSWGGEDLSNDAIRIPRILLMQGQSERVKEDKASQGDMINSITGEVLCSKKDSLAIVPIYLYHDWQIMELIDQKYEFKTIETYTPQNANRPREEVIDGVKVQNNLGINILCLLERDLQDPSAIPYLITFRRTNSNVGKDINVNVVKKAAIMNRPACFFTASIGVELRKKGTDSWFVNKLTGVKETPSFEKHVGVMRKWYETFKQGSNVVVDKEESMSESTTDGAEFTGKF